MDLEQKLRSLPKLIKIEIMSFFPSKKLLKIYKYNKEFQNYLKINNLYILFSNKILNEKNQAILTNCENKLYNLIIWKNIEECSLTFLNQKLCDIKEINLLSLSLEFDYNCYCNKFLKAQKNLKYLHIQNPIIDFNDLILPNLQELSLKFSFFRIGDFFNLNYIEKLKSFEIWHLLGGLTMKDYLSYFNMVNNLNSLTYFIDSKFNLDFCIFLIKQNNKLNKLSIEITFLSIDIYLNELTKVINENKNLNELNVKLYSRSVYKILKESLNKENKILNINLIN
jgi:hypothetical protein